VNSSEAISVIGVEIWEFQPTMLPTKLLISDRYMVSVGLLPIRAQL
jgi:hypothetical protein